MDQWFWSGILWQLFHKTKREKFKEAAIQQEQLLESALYHFSDVHHDVGFYSYHRLLHIINSLKTNIVDN